MDVKTDEEQNFIRFITDAKDLGKNLDLPKFNKIMIAGMGGSGIAGKLLNILIQDIPLFAITDYKLPKFADKNTLVVIISYSGNTEEMISCYNDAKDKGCNIVAITSGGNLKEKCFKDETPYIRIPGGIQPRASLPYLIIPILNILKYNIDLNNLKSLINNDTLHNKARDLAKKLKDKIPIIYSSSKTYPVAYRWKTQFNENTKIHAFANAFSELNHNELEAYENLNGDYYVIIIRDEEDNVRMKKRMELTKELIISKGVEVTEISITGKNAFNRMMAELYIGDLTSIYLAELYEIDPTPVKLIEEFKKNLKK